MLDKLLFNLLVSTRGHSAQFQWRHLWPLASREMSCSSCSLRARLISEMNSIRTGNPSSLPDLRSLAENLTKQPDTIQKCLKGNISQVSQEDEVSSSAQEPRAQPILVNICSKSRRNVISLAQNFWPTSISCLATPLLPIPYEALVLASSSILCTTKLKILRQSSTDCGVL